MPQRRQEGWLRLSSSCAQHRFDAHAHANTAAIMPFMMNFLMDHSCSLNEGVPLFGFNACRTMPPPKAYNACAIYRSADVVVPFHNFIEALCLTSILVKYEGVGREELSSPQRCRLRAAEDLAYGYRRRHSPPGRRMRVPVAGGAPAAPSARNRGSAAAGKR